MERRHVLAGLLALFFIGPAAASPVVVHEWGTFTSLQDETGRAIGGINTDDEPVPFFVHRLSWDLLLHSSQQPARYFKDTPACHPDVTMRLETPVLYFHLPADQRQLEHVTVTASFHGGWLTEFYPQAAVEAPGIKLQPTTSFGRLTERTTGTLTWSDLTVGMGGDALAVKTSEHVWTAPRAVQAASVMTADREVERFLFYRGLAHLDAPLAISRDAATGDLLLRERGAPLELKTLWLVDIDASGRVAFRAQQLPAFPARMSSGFAPSDYSEANREALGVSLHAALVAEGLFDDEAQALLNTWELSYFKSAGMRVFFLVPQTWTDAHLPLNVSVPAEITRVMVGRIEVVTPAQRKTLQQLAAVPAETIRADSRTLDARYNARLMEVRRHADQQTLADYGIAVPDSYALYLSLGRFRNALLLDAAKQPHAGSLNAFISTYRLQGYTPAAE